MTTILVLDIGSSSVRARLFDGAAQPINGATAVRAYTFTTEPAGASEIDADMLRAQVEACLDEVLLHPSATQITAVGLTTFVGNLLAADAAGTPLTPVYTYADTRSADDVFLLGNRIDKIEMHQRTGCRLHTAYSTARIHWLKRTQGLAPARWLDFGAYLMQRWFGRAACSYSVAAWSGLLNRAALTWDEEWLRVLDVRRESLPTLTDYDKPQVGLTPTYAARWQKLAHVPFYLAVGDGAAANVGSGCVDSQHIALTVGTTAALRTVTAELPSVPSGLWSYRVTAAHHLLGGATSEGGNIFSWARETLKLPADVEAELSQRTPDEHGLTVLPLLAGERSPGWAGDATGTIHGLRLSTTPLDMLQALLESVALRLALIAEQLHAAENAVVVASGGALTASPAWAQMMANALNRPIQLTAESELTARGVALLVLRAREGAALDAYPLRIMQVAQPNAAHVEIMRGALARQRDLYRRVIG
ncbi:MAG: gluconokinase [Anaerolineae bacterium]